VNLSIFGTGDMGINDNKVTKLEVGGKQVVYSPNGGSAHLYIRGGERVGGSWRIGNLDLSRNQQVAEQFLRASLTDRDPQTPNVLFQAGMATKFHSVLFKNQNAFASGYSRIVRGDDDQYGNESLDTLPPEWNARIRLDGELSSDRSGDVIAMTYDGVRPARERGITWSAGSSHYKGWHGSLTPDDSLVPLVIGYPGGGSLAFLRQVLRSATQVVPGTVTNGDLTPMVEAVLRHTR